MPTKCKGLSIVLGHNCYDNGTYLAVTCATYLLAVLRMEARQRAGFFPIQSMSSLPFLIQDLMCILGQLLQQKMIRQGRREQLLETTGYSEPTERRAGEDVQSEGSQLIHMFEEFCDEPCFMPGLELRAFSEHKLIFLIQWKSGPKMLGYYCFLVISSILFVL